MVQAGENLRLTLEPGQPIRIVGKRFRQDLQRHLTLELRVGRLVDLAHPALADQGGDLVVAEPGADCKRHRLWGLIQGSFYIWMGGGSSGCTELPS